MREQPYYSIRTGRNLNPTNSDLRTLLKLFRVAYRRFSSRGFFQQAFGYYCAKKEKYVLGSIGQKNVEEYFSWRLNKTILWPIEVKYIGYSEDDLFDVIEFLYDNVSEPIGGGSCGACGRWHYFQFNEQNGRSQFRTKINDLICVYKGGYELSNEGEIFTAPDYELRPLLQEPLPEYDEQNVNNRVNIAILKFRSRHSTVDDKHSAVRDLADVLEFLRPKLKEVLSKKDESDLFNIANNFAIRHHNDQQKTDYDRIIWHDWMFYFYLSTLHTAIKLIKKQEESQNSTLIQS